MIGNGQEIEHQNRDIVLQPHEGNIKRISELHCAYTPLHYVLMFLRGKDGWHSNIPMHNRPIHVYDEEMSNGEDEINISNKCITAMNYFAYQLQISRSEEALVLH